MPRPRKYFIHNTPVEICTSVQRGLPFVATPYIKTLLLGILASAQSHYPVTVYHFVVMGNHIHLLVVVQNPEDVSAFMRYFKTEVAHRMNLLFGWSSTTFWEEGYDSPTILSPEKFLDRMEYLYLNPVKARLVEQVSHYPGLNSLEALISGGANITGKMVSRNHIKRIPPKTISVAEQSKISDTLQSSPGRYYTLRIEPWAWLNCFKRCGSWEIPKLLASFLERLRKGEESFKASGKGAVLGARALITRDPRIPYKSERSGKRMLCLSDKFEQRRDFISWFKEQAFIARNAYSRFKRGEFRAIPPPGFFFPGGALLANLLFFPFLE